MSADEQTRFLQELAEELNSRDIQLPSFPDVVVNIRTALEDPTCSSERIASVVRNDAVLVAKLLMAANSAFHNRAGIEIIDLDLSISRLGFEVVRNTAITLAVEQIFSSAEHAELTSSIKEIWTTSLSLASMSFVIARKSNSINPDNAFLCGLLHEIGKLYILTKARDFPSLLGDEESLRTVQDEWYVSVGQSIIGAWGFSSEIVESVDTDENRSSDGSGTVGAADVVYLAKILLSASDEIADDQSFLAPAEKLNVDTDTLPALRNAFDLHAQSMRQSLGG